MSDDLFSVRDKFCVVTGGGRGLGEMITSGLIGAGARVLITSRKQGQLQATADRYGDACLTVAADLATQDGIEQLGNEIADVTDRVDVLVNNAGAAWGEPLDGYSRRGFTKVMDINVAGLFHVTQRLLPLLRAAADPQDPARVINIGSIDGLGVPYWETYAYSASKAGVHHLTRHLAKRLTPDHITVNAIAPGYFPSDLTSFALDDEEAASRMLQDIPSGRFGRAKDIAAAVRYLAAPGSAYITGAVLPVDGGAQTTR